MACLHHTVLALAMLTLVSAIQSPTLSLIPGGGLRITHPHESGMTLFAVHYSINKPVPGVAAGDWNFDIRSKTGDEWVHTNQDAQVYAGDTVNYWILVVGNGGGHQITDQSWIAKDSKGTPKPTSTPVTKPPVTKPPVTNPPVTNPPVHTDRPTVDTTPRSTGGGGDKPTQPPTADYLVGGGDGSSKCTSYPCLVFNDEFKRLDFDNWEHEITAGGGGNWEFQYYLNNRSNSYVRDGVLYMKPTLTSERFGEPFLTSGVLDLWGGAPAAVCTGNNFYGCRRAGNPTNYINPIQSARIRTVKSFNLRYGKVEIEAQMPKGDWIWPAIWMLPKHEGYGQWPASGEIDIMESRGNLDLKNEQGQEMGNRHMGATLHWGPYFSENKYGMTTTSRTGNFADRFHKYGLEWDEESMKITLDGVTILNVNPPAGGFWEMGGYKGRLKDSANPWRNPDNLKMAPFDQEFYIILNVAVGGTNGFFGDNWMNGKGAKPWKNTSPVAPKEFWSAKNAWYPTWNPDVRDGEDAAMKIKSVKVWKLKDN